MMDTCFIYKKNHVAARNILLLTINLYIIYDEILVKRTLVSLEQTFLLKFH